MGDVHNADVAGVLFLIAIIIAVIAAFVPTVITRAGRPGIHLGWLAVALIAAGLLYT